MPPAWQGPLVEGRVALITGGGGAIARSIAHALADHGADVLVADVTDDRASRVVDEVRERGRRAEAFVADLTAEAAIQRAVATAVEAFGRVDILINALGEHLALAGPFEESTEDGWDRLYQLNVLHVLRACKAVLPGMRERGWGRIVNFSSVEGIRAMPNAGPYTAFKGAIDSLTKSLGVEFARHGIRINAIAVDKTRSHQVGFYDLPSEFDRHVPIWIPAGRYGEGDDIASVALFLASDLCSWVVGQTIVADGGTLSAGGWYRTPDRWTNSPLLVQYMEDDPTINAVRPPSLQ